MKYKKNNWLNFNDDNGSSTKYGIDAVAHGLTIHCCEGDKPLLFDSEKERDAKIKELRDELK